MSVRLKLTLLLPLIREVILDQLIFQVENLTEVLIEDSSGYVKNTAKYSQKIMKSDEFIKRIYSDEHAADFNHRQIFEDEQNRQDLKESEDDKRSMVIEIACKAREALRQKRREKSATEILHFKSKSLSGQVCKLPKLVKPNFSLRSGSSSRKKKIS